jgi:PAT family beta-lactamase induction signal transducer AmpG
MLGLLLGVFQSRRVAVTALLGFSSGVPLLLTGALLASRLATADVDIKTIGAMSMVGLPYTIKWLWAPLIDRFRWPFLGRRRGWLIVLQLLLIGAIAALGEADPRGTSIAWAAVGVAWLSATQDIIVDAFNTDSLRAEERAAGASMYLTGYKAAMLFTGIAILAVGGWSWRLAYLSCAAAMGVGVAGTLLAEEPPEPPMPTLREALVQPFLGLARMPRAAVVLLFVATYRFSESLVLAFIFPFLQKAVHFRTPELAIYYQAVGFVGTAVGAFVGGAQVAKHGVRRTMIVFGALAALTNLLWTALAYLGHQPAFLIGAAFTDAACGAMASGAFMAFLMSRTERAYSATQFAVLTSLSSVIARLFGFAAGAAEAHAGWPAFWALTTAIALPAIALVPLLPLQDGDATNRAAST